MAKSTPRNKAPRGGTEDDIRESRFGTQAGDDEGEEEEEEEEESEEGDDDEDRGDDHEGSDSDDDDDDQQDDDGEEEEESEEEEEEPEEEGAAASLEELERIARENDGMVPIARLNEVLEERRRLQDFILSGGVSNHQQQRQPAAEDPPPFDLRGKIKERNAAILDGDDDKAADLDMEIANHQQEEADRRAEAKMQQQFERQAAKAAGESVVAAYPSLEKDEESLELVMHTRDLYMAKGMPAAEAIIKAAEKIMGPPPKDEAKPKSVDKPKETQRDRFRDKRESLRRHRQIPPTTHRVGSSNRNAGAELDVAGMSERKFEKLDANEKKEARGDYLPSAGGKKRLRQR